MLFLSRRFASAAVFTGLVFFIGGRALRALEIPLNQGQTKATRVGFVDMERIFREYPETQKARAEYLKELERQRATLAEQERALAALEAPPPAATAPAPPAATAPAPPPAAAPSTPAVAGSSAPAAAPSTPAVAGSSAPAAAASAAPVVSAPPPAAPLDYAELEQRRSDLAAQRQAAAKSLRELEEKRSRQILGSLYQALMQLADEKGVGLVVDKSAILYGQQAVDLTEALSRRVRGLPEEGD